MTVFGGRSASSAKLGTAIALTPPIDTPTKSLREISLIARASSRAKE
jgi:hypothetical protein